MDKYEAPAIIELGSVEDFTQGNGGGNHDRSFGGRSNGNGNGHGNGNGNGGGSFS